MSKALDDLSPRFRPLAFELIARAVEHGIPLCIVNTRRTAADQAANLAKGVSWVQHSKHEDGDAIDVCPYSQFDAHGADKLLWDASDPIWQTIGALGEAIGLRWGGRWKQKDLGHFEFVAPTTGPKAV